jgi:hypothetical protein
MPGKLSLLANKALYGLFASPPFDSNTADGWPLTLQIPYNTDNQDSSCFGSLPFIPPLPCTEKMYGPGHTGFFPPLPILPMLPG